MQLLDQQDQAEKKEETKATAACLLHHSADCIHKKRLVVHCKQRKIATRLLIPAAAVSQAATAAAAAVATAIEIGLQSAANSARSPRIFSYLQQWRRRQQQQYQQLQKLTCQPLLV
jgi:5-enolpyruvylshikimate-3-phosphate synthase